jgi:hypothetical protein
MQNAREEKNRQVIASKPLLQDLAKVDVRNYLKRIVVSRTDSAHRNRKRSWQRRVHENETTLPLDELGLASLSETWTCITDDIELVHHLLALYFCWKYPSLRLSAKGISCVTSMTGEPDTASRCWSMRVWHWAATCLIRLWLPPTTPARLATVSLKKQDVFH